MGLSVDLLLRLAWLLLIFIEICFTSSNPSQIDVYLQDLSPKVSVAMNDDMLMAFTKEDVKTTVFQMGPYKAPRLDGYSSCFYQNHWEVVVKEICHAVLSFLNSQSTIATINHTFWF